MPFTATPLTAILLGAGRFVGTQELPSPVATVTVTAPAVRQTIIEPQPVIQHEGSGALPMVVLVVVAIGCVLIGLLVGRLIHSFRRPAAGVGTTPNLPPAPVVPYADRPAHHIDRPAPHIGRPESHVEPKVARPAAAETQAAMDKLVLACLQLADSVTSPALRSDIERALRAAGYQFLDPIGQPFDPRVHDAVERRATPDARAHNVVAATYRPGCAGRGNLLRTPEVAVYRFEVAR